MKHLTLHPSAASRASVENLEERRLFSGGVATPLDATSPIVPIDVNLTSSAGKKFRDLVATWNIDGGLPTHASGTGASATIDWGDGKTSHGKFVDDGSGVVQIIGSHAWKHEGTFQVVVTVNEFPRKHKHDITQVGVANDSAVVTPKPHKFSVKGTLTGTYTVPLGNPDARSYVFTGTGTAKSLGAVTIDSGTITPPGFIQSASAHGEFVLSSATGTITIDLSGAPQPGGSPVPQKMSYEITDGTGAFANPTGKGTASIALNDDSTFVIVLR